MTNKLKTFNQEKSKRLNSVSKLENLQEDDKRDVMTINGNIINYL